MGMEQLIPLIIMIIVGTLFRGKGKKEAPPKGQPKPFTATNPESNDPVRKLKEMSKQMYRELQKELHPETSEPPSRQTPQVVTPAEITAPRPARTDTVRASINDRDRVPKERHRGRLATHGGSREPVSNVNTHDLIPKNRQDLLKGIVFSEIFGPPKSKR
ncbi:hypothetical protein [Sporosarcina limicola]|uniref:Uncharacterized protein n=1 Tax=Sporosarcina limicola TaxID=34101 RepID=A0A927RDI8_9BACL|nr:hypothetical protein [Sporosarcina limicola]MBE1553712.1 hypothetical protein [Sporosarcina limicola]